MSIKNPFSQTIKKKQLIFSNSYTKGCWKVISLTKNAYAHPIQIVMFGYLVKFWEVAHAENFSTRLRFFSLIQTATFVLVYHHHHHHCRCPSHDQVWSLDHYAAEQLTNSRRMSRLCANVSVSVNDVPVHLVTLWNHFPLSTTSFTKGGAL